MRGLREGRERWLGVEVGEEREGDGEERRRERERQRQGITAYMARGRLSRARV